MRSIVSAIAASFMVLLAMPSHAQPQTKEYRVTRHDYVGNLLVYLAGENDGFIVYMPVPPGLDRQRMTCTTNDGLRVSYTPYRFDWKGPFFTGSAKRSEPLELDSGTAVLEKQGDKWLFSLTELKFDGQAYPTLGPVEVTLGRPPRP